MNVGERIRTLRKNAGMTQEDLGKELGVGKAAVQKYESGQVQNLKSSHIKKMCDLFNQKPWAFIYDDEEMKKASDENDFKFLIQAVQTQFGKKGSEFFGMIENLNEDGFSKLIDYTEDLVEIHRYTVGSKTYIKQVQYGKDRDK